MRRAIIWVLAASLLVALVAWVARNTHWVDTKVPMPPKGEALTNPFYAVQRFAEALGARTTWDRVLTIPPPESVIILSTWHWDLTVARSDALERWVESGGRLVVDGTLGGSTDEFERWSGIVQEFPDLDDVPDDVRKSELEEKDEEACRLFQEEQNGAPSTVSATTGYWICDAADWSFLTSTRNVEWALRDQSGIQAMRVQVGRGRVTFINATPFRERSLFDGDHGWLFVAATGMRRGDDLHFLSEDDHPSLLALLWQYGAPVVTLALALLGLVLWRGGVRFGPLAAAPDAARRSLAEQIRGTGQFALRHGGGDSLHAAAVRALDEVAQRRIVGYASLTTKERATALARLTGIDWKTLAAAVHHGDTRRSHELRQTIALVEAARRQLLHEHTRSSHGTQ